MSVRVKICGITSLEDARCAVELGASAVGFNFYSRSPRCITAEAAKRIADELPAGICRVGVFVNAERAEVATIARTVGLTALQFHGDESPADCVQWDRKVIKAVRVRDANASAAAAAYAVDFILADAYVESMFGGSGKRIEVPWLKGFAAERLIVAGGLTADNVAALVRDVRPFGVDVASGVEQAPGRKDPVLMRRFIENAHAA